MKYILQLVHAFIFQWYFSNKMLVPTWSGSHLFGCNPHWPPSGWVNFSFRKICCQAIYAWEHVVNTPRCCVCSKKQTVKQIKQLFWMLCSQARKWEVYFGKICTGSEFLHQAVLKSSGDGEKRKGRGILHFMHGLQGAGWHCWAEIWGRGVRVFLCVRCVRGRNRKCLYADIPLVCVNSPWLIWL